MKKVDILRDLLQNTVENQLFYNNNLIEIENPEVRQIFTQMRDDEMRAIVRLQQKINKCESKPGIISKMFTTKPS